MTMRRGTIGTRTATEIQQSNSMSFQKGLFGIVARNEGILNSSARLVRTATSLTTDKRYFFVLEMLDEISRLMLCLMILS